MGTESTAAGSQKRGIDSALDSQLYWHLQRKIKVATLSAAPPPPLFHARLPLVDDLEQVEGPLSA